MEQNCRLIRVLTAVVAVSVLLSFSACQQRTGKNGEKLTLKQEIRAMVRGNRDKKKTVDEEKLAKLDTKPERIKPEKPRKPKITLYVAKECVGCKELEGFLRQNKISFQKRDIIKTQQGRDFYASVGGTVPITTVDSEVIRGYEPEKVFREIEKKSLPPGQQPDSYRF